MPETPINALAYDVSRASGAEQQARKHQAGQVLETIILIAANARPACTIGLFLVKKHNFQPQAVLAHRLRRDKRAEVAHKPRGARQALMTALPCGAANAATISR